MIVLLSMNGITAADHIPRDAKGDNGRCGASRAGSPLGLRIYESPLPYRPNNWGRIDRRAATAAKENFDNRTAKWPRPCAALELPHESSMARRRQNAFEFVRQTFAGKVG